MGNTKSSELTDEFPNFFSEPDEPKPSENENFVGTLSPEGLPDGKGTLTYSAKDERKRKRYEGDWVSGKRTGTGTLWWQNGAVYRGGWEADQLCGVGTFMFPNKLFYEGEFKGNRFNGLGVLIWSAGKKRYEGSWKNNKHHGYGCLTFGDADPRQRSYYKGEWREGKRNGYGVMGWNNGSKYEGNWVRGKRDGYGKHSFASGDVLMHIGNWSNGKREGTGTTHYTNGDRCEGTWKKDKLHGRCCYYYAHGRKVIQMYDNGKLVESNEKQEISSLEILCIETIAKHKKLVNQMDGNITPELAERVRKYKENQLSSNPFSRALKAIGNHFADQSM